MANDTVTDIEPLEFHSCNTPRGMLYYNMSDLTDHQQMKLNDLKIKTVREDEQYLADHPEIRACVALITRHIMKLCPRENIHEAVAKFYARSRIDIEEEVKQYVKEREPHNCESDSAVGLYAMAISKDSSFEDMSTFSGDEERFGSEFSGSLRNIDVNMQDLPNMASNTLINSISQITNDQRSQDQRYDQEKLKKSVLESMMEDIIVNDVLDKIPYPPETQSRTDFSTLSQKVSFSPKVFILLKEQAARGVEEPTEEPIQEPVSESIPEENEEYVAVSDISVNTETDEIDFSGTTISGDDSFFEDAA